MLYRTYERIIVQARLDPHFGAQLLHDPCRAALDAGLSPMIAESLAGLQAATLSAFAALVHQRVYGETPPGEQALQDQVDLAAAIGAYERHSSTS